jgi:hypothetical protein
METELSLPSLQETHLGLFPCPAPHKHHPISPSLGIALSYMCLVLQRGIIWIEICALVFN